MRELVLTPSLLAGLLAAIASLAALRAGWSARRRGDGLPRRLLLVLAPFALAALLWPVLMPPPNAVAPLRLVVATAGAPASLAAGDGERLVALPEAAAAFPAALHVPDLGSALRRHPEARALRIVGSGLPARDRDAAAGLPLHFEPAALPAGLVELRMPARIAAGRRWTVRGRVEGGAGGTLELRDPAGAVVASRTLDATGEFALTATAGFPGHSDWTLRRRDAGGEVVETANLPLQVEAGAPLRLLVLAGGIDPESKYLRRWALDAGLALGRQASLGGGVEVGDFAGSPTAAQLAEIDLLILDDRRWSALGPGGRETLRAAVRDGLGVLLRLTAEPTESERAGLRDWGFELMPAALPREVDLPGAGAAAVKPTRRPLRLAAADGALLQADAAGEPLALWRAEGRGRVALWNLGASFRLQLAGHGDMHGELWAHAVTTLARARGGALPAVPVFARVGERAVFCDLPAEARIIAPDGGETALLADATAAGCAGFWPVAAGWHALQTDDATASFHVLGEDELPGLAASERREATLALAANAPATAPAVATTTPGPRWPWLLAWLLLAALAWWLERPKP
ncbi:hypothetical protein [Arenimonas composti]|uniref:Carboxypeptidase regulatory-like domain-containing protein n=1 Tax=Arenimonas composti TR7-09 = DSM 18010 TaxID=1121013 RepID=A0A091BYM9_9GAMM|nr:hypothetical protein [Arenimonas composti]KFN49425.1 hypothetical protein P873_10655 [Arenimonas composti TR7-09 = DSM 18010]